MNMMANKTTAANDKVKSAVSSVRASTGNVETDLQALREDIASLADTVARLGSNSVRSFKKTATEGFEAAKESGSEMADYLSTHAHDMEKQLVETVRDRPLISIAAAASVGLLLGLLTKR